ncbi:MAG: flap structure-specific endonuclease [Candidatus Hodarchaeota archaeon]
MGVKLQDLIVRKPIEFQTLAGKIIAVDAPNIIMGLFNFTRKNPDGTYAGLILDRTQRPISHLYGLLYRINFYYSKKIFPIFCFDGRDSEYKKLITKDRLRDFRFTRKWYEEEIKSGDKNAARQIALSKEYLWQNIILESKQLLEALGVPYVDSPASAESQCVYLVKEGIAHYSNSQDFDSLLFGCPHLVQNLSKSLRRKVQGKWTYTKITPLVIDLRKNLKKLEINQFQLVDWGLLVGTDYFPGIKGIGPKKALKYIKEYKQVEKVLSTANEKNDMGTLTPEIIKTVRKIFLFPEVNKSPDSFYWNFPYKPRVVELLCSEHYLNKERVESNLEKLASNYQKCRDYFLKLQEKPKSIQLTLDNII